VSVPLWLRWFLSVAVAAVILILVIRFVSHNNSDATAAQSPSAAARANEESTVIVEQDEAPHVARVTAGEATAAAITKAVRADINHSVNQGFINGPIEHAGCAAVKTIGRVVRYHCTVVAANINYPFLGVVDLRTRQITYCKKDPPPVPSENVPVSRRCTS
jgi:Tfp pilus assembly protein PilX